MQVFRVYFTDGSSADVEAVTFGRQGADWVLYDAADMSRAAARYPVATVNGIALQPAAPEDPVRGDNVRVEVWFFDLDPASGQVVPSRALAPSGPLVPVEEATASGDLLVTATYVVPKGTEHKPSSPGGSILMFEPRGTSTTGDRHEGEIPDHIDSTTGHTLG